MEETNLKIAQFMALDQNEYEIHLEKWGWFDSREPKNFSDLKYHKSWDWLMPVVEAIEALDPNDRVNCTYTINITNRGTDIEPSIWGGNDGKWLIRHNYGGRRLMNTYDAIIEFLERYEELKWRG